MSLLTSVKSSLFQGQEGRPSGLVGHLVGERMVRQHVPETLWTLSQLDLQPQDQVLEIGFGAGRAIELAATQTPNGHVFGLELSQAMLRSAALRNARALKAGCVTLRCGDVSSLPFADNQFDKAFSIQSFYFWPDPLRALAELFRVLKPGALLVVTLSTGTTNSTPTGLERYQQILEEQIIPAMQQLGYTSASIKHGPPSRQFKTTALLGIK